MQPFKKIVPGGELHSSLIHTGVLQVGIFQVGDFEINLNKKMTGSQILWA